MKKNIVMILVSLIAFSGCALLDDPNQISSQDNEKLNSVYDVFQSRYTAQKKYVDQNSFDTIGQSDLKETEKILAFLNELLNDGAACVVADYQYDALSYYFPWYKQLKPVDKSGSLVSDAGSMKEFCYSNLTGSAVYSFQKDVTDIGTAYAVYGYLPSGVNKNYFDIDYKESAVCKLGEWTDTDLKVSCEYKDDKGVMKIDSYAYDFLFEEGSLIESCSVDGDKRTCNSTK